MILLCLTTGMLVLLVIIKYVFQKVCLKRKIRWPDLGIADTWQYEMLTKAYKIKNESNRKITITASDGTKLVGHYYERSKKAPIIIFFHGLWANTYTNGVPIYKISEMRGWNLLLVSLRAHDESGGSIATLGVLERYDCYDWANWVASAFGEQIPIFLMGISMGGAIVLMSSDLDLPKSVRGIIADAGFTSPLEMIKINSKERLHHELWMSMFVMIAYIGILIWGGVSLKDANVCASVSKSNLPVLLIHGDKDTQAPLYMAYRIYNSCQSDKTLYIVHGSGHTECYRTNPEKYTKIISEFIEKHLL